MGKLLKTGKKIKYKGCDCDVYEGPRGGRYVEWKGGMVSVPRGSSTDKKEVGEIIKGGIEEVFGVCKLNELTIGHLTMALLLLFEFRTRFEDVKNPPSREKCTCSPKNWVPLDNKPPTTTVPSLSNPETHYDIVCDFCRYVLEKYKLNDILFKRTKWLGIVDDYVRTMKLSEVSKSQCLPVLDNAMRKRFCSWHPMHDYIMKEVLKMKASSAVRMEEEGLVAPEFARLSSRPKRYTMAKMPTGTSALTTALAPAISMEAARSLRPRSRLSIMTRRS